MSGDFKVGVLSDIHYASEAEQARGDDYELRAVRNPALRVALRWFRFLIWLRYPLRHNNLFDAALSHLRDADFVVANGDLSCDTGFIGLADDAAFQSAALCLGKLREHFPARSRAVLGDHELGKFSFVGKQGGLRLASFHRAVERLEIEPFWQRDFGRYTLMGVCSSLLALPLLQSEMLEAERPAWEQLRVEHLESFGAAWDRLPHSQRVILFCHDPTALPFLWCDDRLRNRIGQIEATIIGHLHSPLIFWKSRWLAGMPELRCFGHSARKMTHALREARVWKPFRVHLCPSLAGIELLKDGGFLTLDLDLDRRRPLRIKRHRLPR